MLLALSCPEEVFGRLFWKDTMSFMYNQIALRGADFLPHG
jgi:hypothetical protein